MTPASFEPGQSVFSLDAIRKLIAAEERADADVLHLTANETVLSPLALATVGSLLNSRYLLEHLDMRRNSPSRPGNFLFRGMNDVKTIERSATEVALVEAVAAAATRSQRMYVRRHGLVFWGERAEDCRDMLTSMIESTSTMR